MNGRLITSMVAVVGCAGLLVAGMAVAGSSQGNHQPVRTGEATPIPDLSRQPSPAARQTLLDPNDTIVLLLDHQTGLFQTVKDVPVAELRNNTVALANIAKLGGAPIIYTASEPNGPNGPLMDELDQFSSYAQYVPRKGEVSAWDNADFVKAVEATGRKTLVMAGVWTSVCVAFPALQAKADGYKVYFVTDASGDPSLMASQTTLARMTQAGIIPVSTNVVLCEFQRTWNRPDAREWGAIYNQLVPHYKAGYESFHRRPEGGEVRAVSRCGEAETEGRRAGSAPRGPTDSRRAMRSPAVFKLVSAPRRFRNDVFHRLCYSGCRPAGSTSRVGMVGPGTQGFRYPDEENEDTAPQAPEDAETIIVWRKWSKRRERRNERKRDKGNTQTTTSTKP